MEAVVCAAHTISQKRFPCLPYVAWAYMRMLDFTELEQEGGDVVVSDNVWAIPQMTTDAFFSVPEDFLVAAFKFLKAFPEARDAVQPLQPSQSAPTTEALQRTMEPNTHAVNLRKLSTWLQAGRSSIAHKDLAEWGQIGLCIPYWKDRDFFMKEMTSMSENMNMAPLIRLRNTCSNKH